MGIQIGRDITRGERLYRQIAAAVMALDFTDRLSLFNAMKDGRTFASLPAKLQAVFEAVARAMVEVGK